MMDNNITIGEDGFHVQYNVDGEMGPHIKYNLFRMTDLVSVIVPIYNKGKHLRACLDSIVSQSYKNLDIVLVEDGSTDESFEIAQEYAQKDSRINLYCNQVNHGVSYSRNKGMELAKAEYITFVDADDTLDNNAVEKMLSSFYRYNIDWAVFGIRMIDGDKKRIFSRNAQNKFYLTKDIQFLEDMRRSSSLLSCCAKMYKKSKIKVNFEDYMIEDMLFNVKYIENIDKAYLFSDIIYNYVNVKDETTRSQIRCKDNINNYADVSDEMAKVVERVYPNNKRAYYLVAGFVLSAIYANFAMLYRAKASKEEIMAKIEQDVNDARIQKAIPYIVPTTEIEQEFQENLQNKDLEGLYTSFEESYQHNEELYQEIIEDVSTILLKGGAPDEPGPPGPDMHPAYW